MPTPPLDDRRKVTLNLFGRDIDYLKAHYDRWSEKVREIVHDFVRDKNRMYKDD